MKPDRRIIWSTEERGNPTPRMSTETQLRRRLRRIAFDRQEGRCYWCNRLMHLLHVGDSDGCHEGLDCTAEHLVPLAHGGATSADNIVAACNDCNNRRHDEAWVRGRKYGDWFEDRT